MATSNSSSSWNFHNFAETLARHRKNNHGISKVNIVLDLLDFIADYQENVWIENGKTYQEFKRITEETTARKLYNDTPNPIPRKYIKVVSSRNFDLKKLNNEDFRDWLKHFELEPLTKDLTRQIRENEVYLTDEPLQELIKTAENNSAELFIASALVDVIKFRDNAATEEFSRKEDKIFDPTELLKDTIDDSSFNLLEHITQEVSRNEFVVRRLILMAAGNPSPLDKNEDLRKIFHLALSGIKRDIYRKQVMMVCLQEGYFAKAEHHNELLGHIKEFTDQKHLAELLEYIDNKK